LLTSIYNEINEKDERKERLKRNCKSLENIDPLSAGKALSLMNADAFSSIYRDSACTYLSSGEEYYSVLISKLKTAKHFIFLEYFIIDKGYMLNGILDVLREKIKGLEKGGYSAEKERALYNAIENELLDL
jgi:cardiolipin synthase